MNRKQVLGELYKLGAFGLTKLLTRNIPKILMYHRFGRCSSGRRLGYKEFIGQLESLKRNFQIVALLDLLRQGKDNKRIASSAVVITIDDGYRDFYEYAYPLLKKYDMPATLFVTTEFIDGMMWQWTDVIEYILENTKMESFSLKVKTEMGTWDLRTEEGRSLAWNATADYCLTMRDEERNEFLKEMKKTLNVQVPEKPTEEYKALEWRQLEEMQRNKIEIGSHTCTHARLTLSSLSEANREIMTSKERIESMLNNPVVSFAYPFGRAEDFDENIKKIVSKSGYEVGVKGYYDWLKRKDILELGRFGVGGDFMEFRKIVYGIRALERAFE